MITNTIKKIDSETIAVPVIIRANEDGWVPTFDLWSTTIDDDTSYIDCTQAFGKELKHYSTAEINPQIGYYDGKDLIIFWKALFSSTDLEKINERYNGKVFACTWQRRYCMYVGKGSNSPRLHSVIMEPDDAYYAVHHINGVSVDNRRFNLHILPKVEHDSINHPGLEERKLMFANPSEYWKARRELAIKEFITQLALIITFEGKASFIARFAAENITLAKQILEAAKIDINLSSVNSRMSRNRTLNPHLRPEYLDTYEMEKYLKKVQPNQKVSQGQIKFF